MSPEWEERMLHELPKRKTVDRWSVMDVECTNKTVLNLGATEPLHSKLEKIARKVYGLDKNENLRETVKNFIWCNLDRLCYMNTQEIQAAFPEDADVVVAGEILEHLSNPGILLDTLRGYGKPVIITAPNAFSCAAQHFIRKGHEQVNAEHVCWYSWHTMKVLLERHSMRPVFLGWYGEGREPVEGEGVIFRCSL